jgi:site-specific recombinase XerD
MIGDVRPLVAFFGRHLRASNLAPRTIQSYQEAAWQLAAFLEDRGMPSAVAAIRREHVESFVEDRLARFTATTAAVRFRSLQQFFRFLVEDWEITESPIARMRAPKIPESAPPVPTEEELPSTPGGLLGSHVRGPSRHRDRQHLHRHRHSPGRAGRPPVVGGSGRLRRRP